MMEGGGHGIEISREIGHVRLKRGFPFLGLTLTFVDLRDQVR